jgi:dTDP-4-dehydrorhamnose reductase
MNVLVIGRSGQLARELLRCAWPDDMHLHIVGRPEVDVTNRNTLTVAIATIQPDIIVNASAYNAVDRAESEGDSAFAVNQAGVRNLALEALHHGIPLIHVSTDYVFDGRSTRPWKEDDKPNPLSTYGRSKLAGEREIQTILPMHVILRTSWLFAAHGQNFVRTMLRLGAERDSLSIVDDQIGCPTAAADLADTISRIAGSLISERARFGVYHYAGAGAVSWFEFANRIFAESRDILPKSPSLRAITTAAFGAPAARPSYSVLDCRKIEHTFGIATKPWTSALEEVLREIRSETPDLPGSRGTGRP